MNRGELVDRLLGRTPGEGPRFLPLLGEFLALLRQQTVTATFSDPGVFFASLRDARQLLGLEAHLVYVHPASLAEAAGLSVAWDGPTPLLSEVPVASPRSLRQPSSDVAPTAVEAFRRISLTDYDVPRGLILPGPAAFGQLLLGNAALERASVGDEVLEDAFDLLTGILLQVVRACGEIGLDLLFVYDDHLLRLATTPSDLLDLIWSPIGNLAGFYESPVVLASRGLTDSDETASALKEIAPSAFVSDASPSLVGREQSCALGLGLDAEQISDRSERGLASLRGIWHEFPLVSSMTPLTTAVGPEDLLAIRRMVESSSHDPEAPRGDSGDTEPTISSDNSAVGS